MSDILKFSRSDMVKRARLLSAGYFAATELDIELSKDILALSARLDEATAIIDKLKYLVPANWSTHRDLREALQFLTRMEAEK